MVVPTLVALCTSEANVAKRNLMPSLPAQKETKTDGIRHACGTLYICHLSYHPNNPKEGILLLLLYR